LSNLSNSSDKLRGQKVTTTVPISELKQRTGKILHQAVVDREDIIVERYGQEYVVILSVERYQALLNAAQARVRERFMEARQAVYEATAEIPPAELDELVEEAIQESRRERAGLDAGHS
jgi:prevent-host-death family protein